MITLEALRWEMKQVPDGVERRLASFFQEHAERYAYSDFLEPLYFDLVEFVLRRGKRLRPLIFLLSYRIFGGIRPLEDRSLLQGAVSLELLHAFILIHDDIIDQAERRRGLPTFHKLVEERERERLGGEDSAERIGRNVAMVAGDMLFALAVEALLLTDFDPPARQEALARFLRSITDTGAGEIEDILLAPRDLGRVRPEEIERMYTLKTTRYTFEAPFALGAVLAGASMEVISEISSVTEPLGLAFQIQNDLLEYRHFDMRAPQLQADLLEGKKTLLLKKAFERLGELDRSFLQLCLGAVRGHESGIVKVKQLIDQSGAVGELEQRVRDLIEQAHDAIEKGSFLLDQKEGLREAIVLIRQQTQALGTASVI